MRFDEIKNEIDAYNYAEEKGGVPKVPFMRMWQFYNHNEKMLILASKTMQEIFREVDSECQFRIGEIKEIKENKFSVEISTGDTFEFKVGQTYLMNKMTAQEIEQKVAKAKAKAKAEKLAEKEARQNEDKERREAAKQKAASEAKSGEQIISHNIEIESVGLPPLEEKEEEEIYIKKEYMLFGRTFWTTFTKKVS